MKKTLIALLALGSMAMGEEAISLFTIAPTTTTAATATAAGTYTSVVLNPNEVFGTITASDPSALDITGVQTLTASGYTNSMFSVQTNIGNGGSYTFEQDFTVDVLDGATVTLTSLDVDFFAYGSGGQQQTVERGLKATLTLTKGEDSLFGSNVTEITIPAGPGIKTAAYDEAGNRTQNAGGVIQNFTLSPNVDLSAGNYTLSIKVENLNPNVGTFIGVGHVEAKGTVSQVPEPATGTLSLLALAALAARRRRK